MNGSKRLGGGDTMTPNKKSVVMNHGKYALS